MADETQSWPLAPARVNQRSDDENPAFKTLRKERTNKCFVYAFTFLVIQAIAILIFALIALRAKSPRVIIKTVHVTRLRYSESQSSPFFNATLVAELSIRNPNFGPYRFGQNNSAAIFYGGAKVGDRRISGGTANVKGTKNLNVTVEIRSSLLPQGTNDLVRDLRSGVLNLTSHSSFSGRVFLIRVLKSRKTTKMNCTMSLVLKTRQVKNLKCD